MAHLCGLGFSWDCGGGSVLSSAQDMLGYSWARVQSMIVCGGSFSVKQYSFIGLFITLMTNSEGSQPAHFYTCRSRPNCL